MRVICASQGSPGQQGWTIAAGGGGWSWTRSRTEQSGCIAAGGGVGSACRTSQCLPLGPSPPVRGNRPLKGRGLWRSRCISAGAGASYSFHRSETMFQVHRRVGGDVQHCGYGDLAAIGSSPRGRDSNGCSAKGVGINGPSPRGRSLRRR